MRGTNLLMRDTLSYNPRTTIKILDTREGLDLVDLHGINKISK
jgi:hypothetical protein